MLTFKENEELVAMIEDVKQAAAEYGMAVSHVDAIAIASDILMVAR